MKIETLPWSGAFLSRLNLLRRALREFRFKRQSLKKILCGNYEILAPEKHTLIRYHDIQPYRNLCIGISAGIVSDKYGDSIIVDVGANIGDTAAIIASYSNNDLVLVEPDDYFYQVLEINSASFPNNTRLLKTLVANGDELSGDFTHWGGTAKFQVQQSDPDQGQTKPSIKSMSLPDIAGNVACFVKIDTDGFDYRIVLESLEWLASTCPAILFENEIRSDEDLDEANCVFLELNKIGYTYYIVWDDPGIHLVSTSSIDTLIDLNLYLWRTWQGNGRRSIFNYNVLALHQRDEDLFERISKVYRRSDHSRLLSRPLSMANAEAVTIVQPDISD